MSKVRFLKVSSFYPGYLQRFYQRGLIIPNQNYRQDMDALMGDCFGWADFWKKNLEKTGKFEAEEIVFNAEQIQKKWASENNLKYSSGNWQQEIVLEQIQRFTPEVLFVEDIYKTAGFYKDIRKKVPSLKMVIGWDGILFHQPEIFRECDLVVSCVEETVEFYKRQGFKSYFNPFGFEHSILKKLHEGELKYNVTFAGSIVLDSGYHEGRLKLLAALDRKTPVNVWASSLPRACNYYSKAQLKRLFKGKIRQYLDLHQIGKKNEEGKYGLEMYQLLRDSKIVFNTHGDNSLTRAANMRLTEATGVGACLVTDWKENIPDYFVPDKEVITYKTIDEAADKIKFLLSNESKRAEIAAAGQKRTLENYSFEKRVRDFSEYLLQIL